MKRFLILLALLVTFNGSAQDPQTNDPNIIYPLLDEYIKEGYNRNYRIHAKRLNNIDFIYLIDIPYANPDSYMYHSKGGSLETYMVYFFWKKDLGRKSIIALNVNWYNNYYVLRRMMFKAIGFSMGLQECHKDCRHIMSGKPLMDAVLVFYDAVPGEWSKELDLYYKQISESKF